MWRYLPPNKSSEGPRHIFTVAVETRRGAHPTLPDSHLERLRLGVARYCRVECEDRKNQVEYAFDAQSLFWGWLDRRCERRSINWVILYDASYSLRVLGWQRAVDSGALLLKRYRREKQKKSAESAEIKLETGILALDGLPTIVDCWARCGARIRFCDFRNWHNVALGEIAESVDMRRLSTPDPWECDEAWIEHARRDAGILEESMYRLLLWHRGHDLGVFRPTTAGQSMQCYRHRFDSAKIVVHDEADVRKLEAASYYAGRLDIFYRGRILARDPHPSGQLFPPADDPVGGEPGIVYKLDVNGLYPYVMCAHRYPRRLISWETSSPTSRTLSRADYPRSICTLSVNTCSGEYPVRRSGRVVWSTGCFTTALAGPEIAAIAATSSSITIEAFATYELADLFGEYVSFFRALREDAKKRDRGLESRMCKLLLNALYGKFAQRKYEWVNRPTEYPPEPWSHWAAIDRDSRTVREYRAIGKLVQERQARGYSDHAFVAIPAFVSAHGRVHMDRLRTIAGDRQVYYQGVDSLFVTRLGLDRLQSAGQVDDTRPGALRLLGESRDTRFLERGVYYFAGHWTRCSIKTGAVEISDCEYQQDQYEGLAMSCTHPPEDGVRVKTVRRSLVRTPSLAQVEGQGWLRRPIDQSCSDPSG